MGGIRIARIFGIDIRVHVSWLVIAVLITASLAEAALPIWHPDWSPFMRWGVGVIAAAVFFASILAHELAHSLVGRRQGMGVTSITLFVFGGVANLAEEPSSPRSELAMTIVGPLTSLAIGITSLMVAHALGAPSTGIDYSHAMNGVGVVGTILAWIGSVNILLAVFNMVPAYPLDGGRVLHSAIWRATGDSLRATQIASSAGRAFAALLVLVGIAMILGWSVPFFGAGLIGGLWLLMIGMFLDRAAADTYQQQRSLDVLSHIAVGGVMRRDPPVVVDTMPLDEFLYGHHVTRQIPALVADDTGRVYGMAGLRTLRSVPSDRWPTTTVASITRPFDDSTTVGSDDTLDIAARRISASGQQAIAVIDHDQLVGELLAEDLTNVMFATKA